MQKQILFLILLLSGVSITHTMDIHSEEYRSYVKAQLTPECREHLINQRNTLKEDLSQPNLTLSEKHILRGRIDAVNAIFKTAGIDPNFPTHLRRIAK